MLTTLSAPAGAALHRLVVEAEPAANVLLRLLEPFVVHDVLPLRMDSEVEAEALRLSLAFHADADLAERLKMRLAVMPVVFRAVLEHVGEAPVHAAA
ncbi:hypothetical protein V5F53_12660 [Xanthobacter sp. V4C-4]|uniref:hypothetical protein n=1 Tax=Xanthobacter cornucopiae TaxID=3119924 RepID=UPI00372BF355